MDGVKFTRPFSIVGVDHAGPFEMKCIGLRNRVRFRSYLLVFVCYSTHALHLEMVLNLITDTAFERFSARCGSNCGLIILKPL